MAGTFDTRARLKVTLGECATPRESAVVKMAMAMLGMDVTLTPKEEAALPVNMQMDGGKFTIEDWE